ncbi:DUF6461 domain-containing protein [Nonomuraea guangzhouensis]|uniref:DUF6461 domain-containing protein n=1 Tax=Nonomuraea guangzhouensis TaxID=1291555 RepID=A0ABW4GAG9_9ACTN|nr:DUF6461 domain-containing protein [Nonomuraea guangzhouensis]
MTIDALTPFRWLQPPYGDRGNLLGEIYCVTLLRGLDPAEVLRRFGARTSTQMSFAELRLAVSDFTVATDGGDGGGYVGVVATGDGCAAVEPYGWSGTEMLARLSAGTDVVSVLRHDYACDYFHYAADGMALTAFDPSFPERRSGADTDRLAGLMHEFGLPLEESSDEDWDQRYDDLSGSGLARMFAMAARLTGVTFTADLLDGPLLVGAIADLPPPQEPQPGKSLGAILEQLKAVSGPESDHDAA